MQQPSMQECACQEPACALMSVAHETSEKEALPCKMRRMPFIKTSMCMPAKAKKCQGKHHLYSSPLATLSFILARLRNQSLEKSLPCVSASATPAPYTARFRSRSP